jgi:hypothetical protein
MQLPDVIRKNFNKGLVTRVEAESIPDGAASDSLNWVTKGDHVELRRGSAILGTEVAGTGLITGLKVCERFDGTEVVFSTFARKINWYTTLAGNFAEISTANILPAAASGEDISIEQYHSLAGAMAYFSSPNSSIYKIPIANPSSAKDLSSTTFKGKIRIKQNRMFLWDRKDSAGGSDKTGLYGSYIDKDELSDYTAVTAEGIGSSGFTTYSGTLFAISAVRTVMYVSFQATVAAGTETFRDNRNGVLTSNFGGTGTINYATSAYSITFSAITTGAVTSDYYHETSTSAGIADFTKSLPRTAGQGFVFRQDDGGAEMQNLGSIGGDEFCFHTKKTWRLTLTSDDLNATNLIYRARVGIPNWRAMAESGEGTYYIDASNESDPVIRLLEFSATGNSEIVPTLISQNIDLSNYRFGDSAIFIWDVYLCVFCRRSTSDYNDTLFTYDRKWKTWDVHRLRGRVADEFAGTLLAGDSISNNVFTLFSGFTDEDANIDNQWTAQKDNLDHEGMKDPHRFVAAGLIQSDQDLQVWQSVDNGSFVLIGTIEGDGTYVDRGVKIGVGTNTVGSKEIGGGGDGVEASPYRREFKVTNGSAGEYFKVKFIATGVGFVSVTEYQYKDIRYKGRKLPGKYVS